MSLSHVDDLFADRISKEDATADVPHHRTARDDRTPNVLLPTRVAAYHSDRA
jgi:hypothetical protein